MGQFVILKEEEEEKRKEGRLGLWAAWASKMGVDSVSPATSLCPPRAASALDAAAEPGETAPGVNELEQVTASWPPPAPRGNTHTHTHTPLSRFLGETHTTHSHQSSSLQRTFLGVEDWDPEAPSGIFPEVRWAVSAATVLGMYRREPGLQAEKLVTPAVPRIRPGTHHPHRLLPEGWPLVPGCSQVWGLSPPAWLQPLRRIQMGARQVTSRQGLLPARRSHRRFSEPRGPGAVLAAPGTRTHTPGAEQLPRSPTPCGAAGVPPLPPPRSPLGEPL